MFLCGNFALKPLQIGEIMSNYKIMQFSYVYWNKNEKKGDEKTTLFTIESAMTAILRDASGKMHHFFFLCNLLIFISFHFTEYT